MPEEVGSNFQIIGGWGGGWRELEKGLPSPFRGIFSRELAAPGPPPPAPPLVAFSPLLSFPPFPPSPLRAVGPGRLAQRPQLGFPAGGAGERRGERT